MEENNQDRHLGAPGEANRDKHINFLAEERNEGDPAEDNRNSLAFGDSHYQTKEEFEKDKTNQAADDMMRPSDLSDDTIGDRIAGSDRTGTSELSSQQSSESSALSGSDNKNASAEPGM